MNKTHKLIRIMGNKNMAKWEEGENYMRKQSIWLSEGDAECTQALASITPYETQEVKCWYGSSQ